MYKAGAEVGELPDIAETHSSSTGIKRPEAGDLLSTARHKVLATPRYKPS
jgi:hypothetical protein